MPTRADRPAAAERRRVPRRPSLRASSSVDRVVDVEWPPVAVRRSAARCAQHAERGADVLGEHANVGALAARRRRRIGVGRRPVDERQCVDLDVARRARNLDAGARVLVVRAARGTSAPSTRGGTCDDRADEARKRRFEIGRASNVRPAALHGSRLPRRRWSSRCRSARSRRSAWARRAAPARTSSPRRSTAAAGRTRAGRACRCARPSRASNRSLRALQRGVRREADRLVEQQHAVDAPARTARSARARSSPTSGVRLAVGRDGVVDQLRQPHAGLDRIVVDEMQLRHRVAA